MHGGIGSVIAAAGIRARARSAVARARDRRLPRGRDASDEPGPRGGRGGGRSDRDHHSQRRIARRSARRNHRRDGRARPQLVPHGRLPLAARRRDLVGAHLSGRPVAGEDIVALLAAGAQDEAGAEGIAGAHRRRAARCSSSAPAPTGRPLASLSSRSRRRRGFRRRCATSRRSSTATFRPWTARPASS